MLVLSIDVCTCNYSLIGTGPIQPSFQLTQLSFVIYIQVCQILYISNFCEILCFSASYCLRGSMLSGYNLGMLIPALCTYIYHKLVCNLISCIYPTSHHSSFSPYLHFLFFCYQVGRHDSTGFLTSFVLKIDFI